MEAREALLARVSTADGATEIKDPATGEVIGRHTFGTPEDVKKAVDKAAAAQPAWAALTDEERGRLISCGPGPITQTPPAEWANTVVQKPSEYTTLCALALRSWARSSPTGSSSRSPARGTWATPWSGTSGSARSCSPAR